MRIDKFGQQIFTENDICSLMLQDPDRTIKNMLVEKPIRFNDMFIDIENIPDLIEYHVDNMSVPAFDAKKQNNWHMPDSYKLMDIAKYVLDQCKNEAELQRAGEELLLFQERDMFMLLRYLKFLVDTMRKNNIIWGVGRGSSVASFVLFLIGIHRINSLYFDLPIEEFLK